MAYYVTPSGDVMFYPDIADRAFLNISPLTFVNKLMVANPNMPVKMLISENIKYTFVRHLLPLHCINTPLRPGTTCFELSLSRATLTLYCY